MGKFSQLFSVSDPQRDCLSLGISAQDEAGMDLFATLTSINYVSAVVLSAMFDPNIYMPQVRFY